MVQVWFSCGSVGYGLMVCCSALVQLCSSWLCDMLLFGSVGCGLNLYNIDQLCVSLVWLIVSVFSDGSVMAQWGLGMV